MLLLDYCAYLIRKKGLWMYVYVFGAPALIQNMLDKLTQFH